MAITRATTNCYAATVTSTEFCNNYYNERVIALRVPGDTATLPLLLLTSFATIATAIAYADASVARVAVLTVFLSLIHI